MRATEIHFGLWELAVLAFLRERPMHPYEMQRLLRERHKDELLVLKRGSLYHAVNRLLRAGLIEAVETGRSGRRPERTTYRITAAGETEFLRRLRQMIAVPKRESSLFMASMSFLVYLKPKDALQQLEERTQRLRKEVDELNTIMSALVARVGRINLLESEYLRAMREAELEWVLSLEDDLRSGRLKWDLEKILREIQAAAKAAKRNRGVKA